MSRTLQPKITAFDAARLQRGSLVVISSNHANLRILRFQYNPETVTRARQGGWEHRKNAKGQDLPTSPSEEALRDNFRGGGFYVKAETISFKLVFDATEAILAGESGSFQAVPEYPENGVLPELALLELIALGGDAKVDPGAQPTGKGKSQLNPIFPTEVLFLLGPRAFPAIITSLTIVEKRYNPALVPIRAEVDLQLRVLEPGETFDSSMTRDAWTALADQRKKWQSDVSGLGSYVDLSKDPFSQAGAPGTDPFAKNMDALIDDATSVRDEPEGT